LTNTIVDSKFDRLSFTLVLYLLLPPASLADEPNWASEEAAVQITGELDEISQAFEDQDPANLPKCTITLPGAKSRREVFSDSGIVVARWDGTEVGSAKDLIKLFVGDLSTGSVRAAFKVVGMEMAGESANNSQQYLSISGKTETGSVIERHATVLIDWKAGAGGLSAVSIKLDGLEESVGRFGAGHPLFSDLTRAMTVAVPEFESQFGHGNHYWRRRIEIFNGFNKFGYNGLAVADVNGDGRDDLYSCQPGALPNRLFIQQPDGTVKELAHESGVDFLDHSSSALFVDFDNDGDQDLALATAIGLAILENSGSGKFSLKARIPSARRGMSMAASDFDLDGDVDLYLCRYYADSADASGLATPIPYFDATNGGANLLIENLGSLNFRDATAATGLSAANTRFSFAALWEDYDSDGDADLYVANDFGRDNLYRNDGGRFTDVAPIAGLNAGAFGMSVSSADYNRDGRIDFYIGNMFSSAGSRISHQPQFSKDLDPDLLEKFQHLARGNTMLRGKKGGGLVDSTEITGVALGRWSWSSLFADVNNDGWEDLLVANGYLSGPAKDDL
jgi:hypothetical protein